MSVLSDLRFFEEVTLTRRVRPTTLAIWDQFWI